MQESCRLKFNCVEKHALVCCELEEDPAQNTKAEPEKYYERMTAAYRRSWQDKAECWKKHRQGAGLAPLEVSLNDLPDAVAENPPVCHPKSPPEEEGYAESM